MPTPTMPDGTYEYPEFLSTFLERGDSLIAEVGTDELRDIAKLIAVPLMAGFTGDREIFAKQFWTRVDAQAERVDDGPGFTKDEHDTLRRFMWIAEANSNDDGAQRFVGALPSEIRDECLRAAAALMSLHPEGATEAARYHHYSLDLDALAAAVDEFGDPEIVVLVILDHAGRTCDDFDVLMDQLRAVNARYPERVTKAVEVATDATDPVDGPEMVEDVKRLLRSNQWSPSRALEVLARLQGGE